MKFLIDMTDEERSLAESYAESQGLSLEEAFKDALFEKIEDEYDAAVADMAYEEYLRDPVTYSMDEVKKELGL